MQAGKRSEHVKCLQSGPGLALGMVVWYTFHDCSSEREGQGVRRVPRRNHTGHTRRKPKGRPIKTKGSGKRWTTAKKWQRIFIKSEPLESNCLGWILTPVT